MTRALYALLLLCGMSWSACAEDAKPLTAILLTARADLPDPHFNDAVVLVMNHLGPAPAGIIINKPTRIPVSHLFPELERLARLDDKVYFGGPVAIESVLFLFRAEKPPEHATEVLDGVYISMNRELLRELLGRDNPMEGLRIFIGYSGWGRGQLEGEIARGDWTLAPADASAIFDGKSVHPWPEPPRPRGLKRVSQCGTIGGCIPSHPTRGSSARSGVRADWRDGVARGPIRLDSFDRSSDEQDRRRLMRPVRTAFGTCSGALNDIPAPALGAVDIRESPEELPSRRIKCSH